MSVAADFATFEQLRPGLLRRATQLVKGSHVHIEPEDLVQAVLTKIYDGLQKGKLSLARIEDARFFAYRSLMNLFLDEVKALRTKLERPLQGPDGELRIDPAVGSHEGSVLVREILSRLSPVERCFLVHAIFEGWAVEEAQRRCDGPPGTPAYRLRQLLDKGGEMIG